MEYIELSLSWLDIVREITPFPLVSLITLGHTPHLVGLHSTRDRPVTENFAWQQTTITTEVVPCPQRVSNPQSQQTSGRILKP